MSLILPSPALHVEERPVSIPRIIHQVWVGSTPPEWVQRLWKVWDEFADAAGFVVQRWTNAEMMSATLTGRVAYFTEAPPVVLADLLRLEVLARVGGLYMDSDTVPIRPLVSFTGRRNSWVAHGQATVSDGRPTLSNAMMGFRPGHPVLSEVFEHGVHAIRRGVTSPFAIAGPTVLRQLVDEEKHHVDVLDGPFPAFRKRQKDLEQRHGRALTIPELRELYPEAAVVHLSATSWVDGGRRTLA